MPKKQQNRKRRAIIRCDWPRIRETTIDGALFFVVDPRPYKRREYFKEKALAKTRADQVATERVKKGVEAVEFPTALRMMAIEANALLEPFEKTILDAARHYKAFLEQEQRRLALPTIGECLEKWIKGKETQTRPKKLRKATLDELRVRARLFAAVWKEKRVSDLTRKDIEVFLDRVEDSQYAKNLKTKLGQFYNYCIKVLEYPIQNPTAGIIISVQETEVKVLEVAECSHLLGVALESEHAECVMPHLILGLFAGLRPGECDLYRWEWINWAANQIKVPWEISKVLDTRYVPIDPTCREWLEKYRKESGPIIGKNFRRKWQEVRAEAGYRLLQNDKGEDWVSDILRHCYGSYWLVVHKNRAELAENMGNSPNTIRKHYRRAIPEKEGQLYWELRPTAPTFTRFFSV